MFFLMPAKKERKIIMLRNQPVISLPIEWARFWKLKKGDSVPVFYDSVLVVIPPTHPDKEKIEQKVRRFLIK